MDTDLNELGTADILTIEEVAKYLRVSGRTVYDWAQKGQIPAGKIGNVWRFKKTELESWVNDKLSGNHGKIVAKKQSDTLNINEFLTPKRIVFLEDTDKKGALTSLSKVLACAKEVTNPEELITQIFKREELMTTAVGKGIAVPHVRLSSIKNLAVAIGVSRNGIADFIGIDGTPVNLIFMIVAGLEQHTYYLKVISYFSAKVLNENLIQNAINAKTEKEVFDML